MSEGSIIKDKDASSIWSGYIFQGEVAICRALETINELIDKEVEIPETYMLKIEEEEDFSIITDSLLIFQVKAYTSHNYVKYAEAWRSLMTRYPENSKDNFLILHKGKLYYNSCEFESSDFPKKELMKSNVIAGKYTLDNIKVKILEQINNLCTKKGLSVDEPSIEHKYYNCCSKINTLIRMRHKSKVVEQILLVDIVDLVADNSIVVTEELAWYKAERRLINTQVSDLG
ncbi:ABC-three component system protein [Bacteroides neonati]|uniref:ABC-three component system protein n=1 Tax=Bacteroides neonati TaxID=1347393 RepID=UPI0004B22CCF|nr:ABC-three component system protein [Bacteroides neonati]